MTNPDRDPNVPSSTTLSPDDLPDVDDGVIGHPEYAIVWPLIGAVGWLLFFLLAWSQGLI